MTYYWVITMDEYPTERMTVWGEDCPGYKRLHMDKLTEKELKKRLESNYYGDNIKWLSINGAMSMVHRLLSRDMNDVTDGYGHTGFIIKGDEVRPIPIEVVTKYSIEEAWLINEHDVQGKRGSFHDDEDDDIPEAPDDGYGDRTLG